MIAADDPIWIEVIELAAIAARPIADRYKGYVDADDLRQVACEYASRRKRKVEEYLVRDEPSERKQGEAALILSMRRECEKFARREKAERSGYRPEDEYFYRPATIEKIIEVIHNGGPDSAGQILDPADMGQKRKRKPASEGGDILALVYDVEMALKELDTRTYGIVVSRWGDGLTLVDIGTQWSISPQRVEQISRRGMRQLIEALGGKSPY
jgi:DNA-directed RNA polymerase specialized sigma24 family protein